MGGDTTLYAYDAAYPPVDANNPLKTASTYKAAGGIAANVYVSGKFAQDAAHVRNLRGGGIAPWPNYEVGLWELVSDRTSGQAAARTGIADAKRCGFPADGTIWFPFSVDVNVDPSRYGQVGAAFDGINDVNAGQYLISCYGQGGLIDYLVATKRIHAKGWLSSSSSFPGYNPGSPNVCLVQEIGSPLPGTDRNVITDPHALRAWWPAGSPYLSGKQPSEDDEMKPYIVAYNKAQWIVAVDLSSRTGIPSGTDLTALNATGQYAPLVLSDSIMAQIPEARTLVPQPPATVQPVQVTVDATAVAKAVRQGLTGATATITPGPAA